MWYAAKKTTYGRAFGRLVDVSDSKANEPRRVFLRRCAPVVSTEVRGLNEMPAYGAMEFDSRAAALEAARLIGGPGRRVAVPVALCPHGCGNLDWVDDTYYCRRCGDEWSHEQIRGYPVPA
jgi:hypothetical protein